MEQVQLEYQELSLEHAKFEMFIRNLFGVDDNWIYHSGLEVRGLGQSYNIGM